MRMLNEEEGVMIMTAKEYLGQIKLLEIKIKRKRSDIEMLRETIRSISSQQYSERVMASNDNGGIEEKVIKYIEMEKDLQQQMTEMVDLRMTISAEIDRMKDPRYAQILALRYVEGFKIEDIALAMGYTERHVARMHGCALQVFEKDIMGKNEGLQKK